MSVLDDMVGSVFGRLTVIEGSDDRKALCKCACGAFAKISINNLRTGNSTSCGCSRRETLREILTTHGGRASSEYKIWLGLKQRCTNPNNPSYRNYGGRGINVCDRWKTSFENFFQDMGPRPSRQHTIDRIDNSKGYQPGNCRWATPTQQMNNTRRNRIVTIDGTKMTLAEAQRSGKLPVSAQKVAARVHVGWGIDEAMFTPPLSCRGEQHHRAKLTAIQVEQIRVAGLILSQRKIAEQFGVSQPTVSRILRDKIWRTEKHACLERKS